MKPDQCRAFARILVNEALGVLPGDKVLIQGPADAKPLILAAYEQVLEMGAFPSQRVQFEESDCIFFTHATPEQLDYLSPVDLAVLENCDKFLFIRTETNTSLLDQIPASALARRRQAVSPSFGLIQGKQWCSTLYPSQALATKAGISLPEYDEWFAGVVLASNSGLAERGAVLATLLIDKKRVEIKSPDTDLSFSIEGRQWVISSGRHNVPDGEIFSAPVEDSVEGHIVFDVPVEFDGHWIENARLEFRKGQVVKASASRGEDALRALLGTDEGTKRVGEFGIGLNEKITSPMGHVCIDEKMRGSIHLALGFSLADTGGKNVSQIHFDFIKDLRQEGQVLVDGSLVDL